MYFSNIIQYCDSMFSSYENFDNITNQKIKLIKMKNIFNYLYNNLEDGGHMVLGYLYEPRYTDQDIAIFNKKLRREVFDEEEYIETYIRSIQSIMLLDLAEETSLHQDICLIRKKNKHCF